VHSFPQKVDDVLVVVLNTQAKTAKLTTPTLPPSPPRTNFLKMTCYSIWGCTLPGGALQLTSINYAKEFLFSPWVVHMHPVQPLATYVYDREQLCQYIMAKRTRWEVWPGSLQ